MIGNDLYKIKESNRADELLSSLKKEEKIKRFYIIKIEIYVVSEKFF